MAELWFANDDKGQTMQVIYKDGIFTCYLQDGREYVFDEGDNTFEIFLVKEGFIRLQECRVIA